MGSVSIPAPSAPDAAHDAAHEVGPDAGPAHRPVDLHERLSLFSEHWRPKVVARLNDYDVKVVKLKGEFVWHRHADTDELFLVIEGSLTIQLRDGDVTLGPGQLYVVPQGVEHRPVAVGDVSAMLVEPRGTLNTGDATGEAAGGFTTVPEDLT